MDANSDRAEQGPTQEPSTRPDVQLRRPIGEIFVELGFITDAQLGAALVVQQRTGARIGEILVEQGSLDRLDLASALAEHWEPHRPEHDVGGPSLVKNVPVTVREEPGRSVEDSVAIADLARRLEVAEQRLASRPEERTRWSRKARSARETTSFLQAQVDGLTERLTSPTGVEAALAELRLSVESLADLRVSDALANGARLAGTEEAIAALEGLEARDRDGLDRDLAGHFETLAARLAHAEERLDTVASLEQRVLEVSLRIDRIARDGHDRAVGLAEELRAEAAARVADLGSRLQADPGETASLRARVEDLEVGAARAVEGWVAFAPTGAGYRLVELPGLPPELGETLEVEADEGLLVVTRYGRSPLPFDGRPCAYLDRV